MKMLHGKAVIDGWTKKLAANQKLKTANGLERIRFGYENSMQLDGNTCHDCAARFEQFHVLGCDAEICAKCGEQFITCGHLTQTLEREADRLERATQHGAM